MIIILFIVFIILFFVYSWVNLIIDLNKLSIQGPLPLPIVGNGHLFFGDIKKFLTVLTRLASKYNDVFRFYILSHRYVCLSDAKYLEAILSNSELINKGRAYEFMRPWIGEGLITSSGSHWKKQRKFLTPAFHFNILQSFLPIFIKNQNILRDKLTKLANGTSIDLPNVFNALTFDNITESVMGRSFNTQTISSCEYFNAIHVITHIIALRVRNPIYSNDILFNLSPQKLKMDKAVEVVNQYAFKVIKERRKELSVMNITAINYNADCGMKNRTSFLDIVLLAELDGEKMNDEEVLSQVNTFMFAGHDTISTAIVFTLYCISNHKEVEDKLLKEQNEIFNGDLSRDPTYSDLQQMKYLETVLRESMRIYPPVPVIERYISRDIDLKGLHIPNNTHVFVNIFNMHRNPNFFDNPLEFRPERFEENLKSPFSWIPFSAGPRNCIGQKFAMTELKVMLSSIVRHFKLLPSGRIPKVTGDVILKSENGVYVSLLPR